MTTPCARPCPIPTRRLRPLLAAAALALGDALAQAPPTPAPPPKAWVIRQVSPNPGTGPPAVWVRAPGGVEERPATNGMELSPGTLIRTDAGGTVTVEDPAPAAQARLAEGSLGEIQGSGLWFKLLVGAGRFFNIHPFSRLVGTPHVDAAPTHTEFAMEVRDDRTLITLFEGGMHLTNAWGGSVLVREAGAPWTQCLIPAGGPPSSPILATNVVQWWLHYPGVLHVGELALTPEASRLLAPSLAQYAAGDLDAARRLVPAGWQPREPDERIYLAALRLTTGQTREAMALLEPLQPRPPLARALETLVAAVTLSPAPLAGAGRTASEQLAWSFWLQAGHRLEDAVRAAHLAAQSPGFGLASARLAELRFAQGQIPLATEALQTSLSVSPRNARAVALAGFLLAADGRVRQALHSFERALELDARLGDAWLGRGLCRIRRGDTPGGLADLRMAAALEPNRALLRSYLAKALQHSGDPAGAWQQLDLARQLDPADPTWAFYRALVLGDAHRFNEAIGALDQSKRLNSNRRLYRSEYRLDEDLAVRGASLARLYRKAGLAEASLAEAAQAVSADYLDASAHLFLAESYDALRDPARVSLRHEAAWSNEMLLANLLAPVGAGIWTPAISHQEYSRLLQQDGIGLATLTEYRSDGRLRQRAWQNGTYGTSAWAFDLDYERREGTLPNTDLDRMEWFTQLKQQVTGSDTAWALVKYGTLESGDLRQLPAGAAPDPDLRLEEDQAPVVLGGWRHQWGPDAQTLVLAGAMSAHQSVGNLAHAVPYILHLPDSRAVQTNLAGFDLRYDLPYEAWSAEGMHLHRLGPHTVVAGLRAQSGNPRGESQLANPAPPHDLFFPAGGTVISRSSDSFARVSAFAYDYWEIGRLTLIGGVTWDNLRYPDNLRNPPLTPGTREPTRLLPKAGFIWNLDNGLTLRSIYARSLGGVAFDDSVRLEPVQLAGFSQVQRGVLPESLVGTRAGQDLEVAAVALDVALGGRTFAGLEARLTRSAVDDTQGGFAFSLPSNGSPPSASLVSSPQHLRFDEQWVGLRLDQLIESSWSAGIGYRFVDSRLDTGEPGFGYATSSAAQLHEARAAVRWNHESGLFAVAQWTGLWQQTRDERHQAEPPSHSAQDDSSQVNLVQLEAGWRMTVKGRSRDAGTDPAAPRRHLFRAELALGLLNALDESPRLSPLNGLDDLPADRVCYVRLKLDF